MSEKFFSIPKEIIRLASSVSSGGNNSHAELKVVDLGEKKAFMLQMASVWIQEGGPIENLSAWSVIAAHQRGQAPTGTAASSPGVSQRLFAGRSFRLAERMLIFPNLCRHFPNVPDQSHGLHPPQEIIGHVNFPPVKSLPR